MMPGRQILIVEDNRINRAMLREILSSTYHVLEAENGQQALEVLKAHRDEISLILLDIVMPVMDGYTFLAAMREDTNCASIPVIVTTQSDSESDEVTALSNGATDFVAKPYKPQVILHRVASIIKLRETAAMINQLQYDPLTGLYSKEFFYQRVREVLRQYPDRQFDIVCSDIENFKLINDSFGMPAGDRLLCDVADLLRSRVKDRGIYGRLNADQFACLLERQEYTNEQFLNINLQINTISTTKNVVMKWGIYVIASREPSVEQMCDRALLAARSIKGQYRKHFAQYDDALRNKLLRDQIITDSMESALACGQFVVYLQPKYSLKSDQLAGAEALVRWEHPEWGFLSPAEFIPLFEKNGFITRLDQFVWDKVCATLHGWAEQGYPLIPISVNMSRADAYQADLADVLMDMIKRYQLSPSSLHLEITESAYTENPGQILNTVDHLRTLGFVIEMDDFGSGYSSLNMLNQMGLDILKLDMKFIQSETAKPLDQGILRFIMSLARWMNLSVVAEGVETREQLERLREIGCDYVQGYFFSRPMSCQEFEQLLKRPLERWRPKNVGQLDQLQPSQILLIVDNDEDYARQVKQTFQTQFLVLHAADIKAAQAYISSCEYSIAAVVLSMALSDSLSVWELLKHEKPLWKIPVIGTGPADAMLEERTLELGLDDYAAKPHTQKSLQRRVSRALGLSSSLIREQILNDEACRDYLTGLLNRRGLLSATKALGKDDVPLAVYLFDLDNLKHINDTLGHGEGDRILEHFSKVLKRYTRATDILSRYGGDEFIVVAKGMNSQQAALNKGEEICQAFARCGQAENFSCVCSAGVAVCDHGQALISELIARADQALSSAKSSDKGGCIVWKG